eukprot:4343597-Alexandrium_andersonii.AAC.1
MDEATRGEVVAQALGAVEHAAASDAGSAAHLEEASVLLGLGGELSVPPAHDDEEMGSEASTPVDYTPIA